MQDDAPKANPSYPSPDSPEAEAMQRKAFGKSLIRTGTKHRDRAMVKEGWRQLKLASGKAKP